MLDDLMSGDGPTWPRSMDQLSRRADALRLPRPRRWLPVRHPIQVFPCNKHAHLVRGAVPITDAGQAEVERREAEYRAIFE